MSLRPDSLAQILSYCNAYPGCRACVFDTGGIVTASLVERLGGVGEVICMYAGQDPPHTEVMSKVRRLRSLLLLLLLLLLCACLCAYVFTSGQRDLAAAGYAVLP